MDQSETAHSLSTRKDFIRQIGHDVQGTFFGVSSLCVMLKDAIENGKETNELMDHLMSACQSYKHKLCNFIEYTRFEAGLQDVFMEQINVRELVKMGIEESLPALKEKNIRFGYEVAGEVPEYIFCDEYRFSQIVSNLLTRAASIASAGAEVVMKIEKENELDLSIRVDTTGEGSRAGECNLDLLVVRYLVEAVLKGDIQVAGQPGGRSSFIVRLPMIKPG
ncbi:MAG: hypothetical protein P4L51_11805 [Puia sp.]|nr:hypothetical protein [Puia sp.]